MFVGHYAASLALKGVEKKASLGWLFIAVQLVDIVFFPLVLLGVEKLNIVPNYTEATHFELVYMPYTHSLLAAFAWAGLTYGVFQFVWPKIRSVAIVMAVGVFSHWVFDLIVHTPDLPLWSDSSPKLGFGLWNDAVATWTLEAVLLMIGLAIYLKVTEPRPAAEGAKVASSISQFGMVGFVIVLILINAANVFGPAAGVTETTLAVSAVAAYLTFAWIAEWLDRRRT